MASDCVYLINFFPEDDLRALFNYFDSNDRIALIYPENNYGNYINDIIDIISTNSNSIIVNKASYLEDISNDGYFRRLEYLNGINLFQF